MARSAHDVWALIGDPSRVHEWWPGITECRVETDGDGALRRTITLGSGVELPETIVTLDAPARRFQYRIDGALVRHHLSTLDVIELEDDSSLIVYGVDADPRIMALIIGGAAGAALRNVKLQLEGVA